MFAFNGGGSRARRGCSRNGAFLFVVVVVVGMVLDLGFGLSRGMLVVCFLSIAIIIRNGEYFVFSLTKFNLTLTAFAPGPVIPQSNVE